MISLWPGGLSIDDNRHGLQYTMDFTIASIGSLAFMPDEPKPCYAAFFSLKRGECDDGDKIFRK